MPLKDQIDLSIVIVTYKSKEHISGCIQSIYGAAQGLSFEIIIVDNNSGDGLVDLIRDEFPDIILVENKENEGFSRGVNKGVGLASGVYLGILNPDAQLHKNCFNTLLNFIKGNPLASVIGARTVDEVGRSIPSYRSLPHIGNIIKYPISLLLQERRLKKPRRYLLDIWGQSETIDVTNYNGYIIGACMLMRLDFFKKMGMFDTRYFLYAEDADFGFRIKQAGYHAFLVSEASATHKVGRSASENPLSQLYAVESYLNYIHKNFTFVHGAVYKTCYFSFILGWTLRAWLRMGRNETRILLKALRCFIPTWLGGPNRLPKTNG